MDARTLDEDRAPSLDDYDRMSSDTVNRDENLSFDGNEERDAYETHHQSITKIKVSHPECKNIMTKKKVLRKSKIYGEDRWSTLPVHSSIFYGAPLKVILNLLSSNPNSLKTKDDCGQLPLHLAFRKGDEDLIIDFLKAYPESFYVKDNKGKMPFQCIAQNHKFSETVSELLESYAHLNCIHKSISSKQEKAIAINDINSEKKNASNTKAREEEGRTMEKRLKLLNDELSSQEDKRSGTPVLEGVIKNLSNKLNSQNADYSVALKKIQDLEEQNSEFPGLKSIVTELKEQIAILERHNNSVELQLFNDELSYQENQRSGTPVLKGVIENLSSNLNSQNADYSVALKKIQDLEEQNSELPGLKSIVTELKEQIAILEQHNNTLEKLALIQTDHESVEEMKKQLVASEERNKLLRENISLLEKEQEENHKAHVEEVQDYKEKLEDLNKSFKIIPTLKEENKMISELEKKVQDVTEELHGKSEQNSKLKESVKNLEEKIDRLPSEEDFNEILKNSNEYLEIIMKLKEENKRIPELEKKIQDVNEDLYGKSKQNSKLKENVKDLEEKINRLPSKEDFEEILKDSNEYLEIIMDLKEKKKMIPELEKKIQDATEDLYGKSKQNSELKEKVKNLEEKINQLPSEDEIQVLLEVKTNMEKSLLDTTEEINVKNKENSELKEKVKNLEEKINRLPSEGEIQVLLEVKENIDKTLLETTEEINIKNKENSEMREYIKILEEMVNRLPSEEETAALQENMRKMTLNYTDHIKELDKEIVSKNEDYKKSSERVNQLEDEKNYHVKAMEDLKKTLAGSEEETAALQENMRKMTLNYTDHIKELENEIASKNKDNKKSSERIHQLEDEKNYHIKAMEDLKKTLAGSEEETAALQENMRKMTLNYTDHIKELENEIASNNKDNKKSSERVYQLEDEKNYHIKAIEDLKKTLAGSDEETAALQEKMRKMTLDYTDHIKELENEITSKNEDYKKNSERIHQLEDEKNYHVKAMEDLKKTLAGSEQKLSDSSVKFAALQEENKFIPRMIKKMNDAIEQLAVKNKENSDIKERAKRLEEQLTKLKDKTKVLMANHEKTTKMISGLLEKAEKRLGDTLKKNSSLEEENSIIPKLNEKIDAIMNYFTIIDDDDSRHEKSGTTTASEKLDIITNHIKKIPSEETFHNFKVQLANLMKSYKKAMELVRILQEENTQILELKQTIDDMNKELITSSEKCSGLDDLIKEKEQLKSSIEKAMKVIAILEEENKGLAVVDDITKENRVLKESIELLKKQICKREKDCSGALSKIGC